MIALFLAHVGSVNETVDISFNYIDCVSTEAAKNYKLDLSIDEAVSSAEGLCSASLLQFRDSYRSYLLADPEMREMLNQFPEKIDESVDRMATSTRKVARASARAALDATGSKKLEKN